MMELFIRKYSYISPGFAQPLPAPLRDLPGEGNFLTALYRSLAIDYPKFFKMDNLSKLGFLASELLWAGEAGRFTPREDMAVLCLNRSASLDTDRAFQQTLGPGGFFPSPSLFVYTLPNIVTGEIAIRNKLLGETSCYICREWNPELAARLTTQALGTAQSALVAWLEYLGDTYEAFMMWIEVGGSFCDVTKPSPEVGGTFCDITKPSPQVGGSFCDVTKPSPEVGGSFCDVTKPSPEVGGSFCDVTKPSPEVGGSFCDVTKPSPEVGGSFCDVTKPSPGVGGSFCNSIKPSPEAVERGIPFSAGQADRLLKQLRRQNN